MDHEDETCALFGSRGLRAEHVVSVEVNGLICKMAHNLNVEYLAQVNRYRPSLFGRIPSWDFTDEIPSKQ
jgi:hypothetical protein